MARLELRDAGYFAPNFRAPLSVNVVRSSIAAGATAKGFYFNALLRELSEQGHHLEEFGPYRDFSDYPITAALDLSLATVQRLYPTEHVREGIRRVAWSMFPTLLGTMVGRVVFGALGNDIMAVMRHANRGFEISLNMGRLEPKLIEPGLFELSVTNFQLLPDCFLVGVFEGSFAHYGHESEVLIRPGANPKDMDYLVRWT